MLKMCEYIFMLECGRLKETKSDVKRNADNTQIPKEMYQLPTM